MSELNRTIVYEVPQESGGRRNEKMYQTLFHMHFATSRLGWAVGSGQLLLTLDGGETWSNTFNNELVDYSFMPTRVFAFSQACFVTGVSFQNQVSYIVSRNNGETWTL